MTNEEMRKLLIEAQNSIAMTAMDRGIEGVLLKPVQILKEIIAALETSPEASPPPITPEQRMDRIEGAFLEVVRDLDGIRSHVPVNLDRRLVALERHVHSPTSTATPLVRSTA